jgi:hypothetical protein
MNGPRLQRLPINDPKDVEVWIGREYRRRKSFIDYLYLWKIYAEDGGNKWNEDGLEKE